MRCEQARSNNAESEGWTDLIEFEGIKQIVQLSILGRLLDLDEVLLETVQGEFRLVVDIDLERLSNQPSSAMQYSVKKQTVE